MFLQATWFTHEQRIKTMHNKRWYPQVASVLFLLKRLYSTMGNQGESFRGSMRERGLHDDYWVRVRCWVHLPDVCPCRECVCMCVCCERSIVLSIWNMRRSSSSKAMSPQNAAGSKGRNICYNHKQQRDNTVLTSHLKDLSKNDICHFKK